jgi:hypothetical protein
MAEYMEDFTSGRIDSNLDALESLHQRYGWIPGRAHIRPRPEDLERKYFFLLQVEQNFASYADSVLISTFGLNPVDENSMPLTADDSALYAEREPRIAFIDVPFPYQVQSETHHSCIWYTMHHLRNKLQEGDSLYKDHHKLFSDDQINKDILESLLKRHPEARPSDFQFAWFVVFIPMRKLIILHICVILRSILVSDLLKSHQVSQSKTDC